jgi:hypothetical protein
VRIRKQAERAEIPPHRPTRELVSLRCAAPALASGGWLVPPHTDDLPSRSPRQLTARPRSPLRPNQPKHRIASHRILPPATAEATSHGGGLRCLHRQERRLPPPQGQAREQGACVSPPYPGSRASCSDGRSGRISPCHPLVRTDVLRLQRQEPHLGLRHLRHLPLPRLLRRPPQPRGPHHLRQVRTATPLLPPTCTITQISLLPL